MRLKHLKYVWWAILLVLGALAFFEFPVPTNLRSAMDLLTSLDAWLSAHVARPSLFALFVGLGLGTVIIPQVWRVIRNALQREASENLRQEIHKLLRYPDAARDTVDAPTMTEQFASNQQPRRLFELLVQYNEKDIAAVPRLGAKLPEFLGQYYEFRQSALKFDQHLLTTIINNKDWFIQAWKIHQRYTTYRLFGLSQEKIIAGGNFLNYSITWSEAEKVFERVSSDSTITSAAANLDTEHDRLTGVVTALKETALGRGDRDVAR